MARNTHLPAPQPTRPVVHYYPDPAMVADLERLNATELAARRAQERLLYGRWKVRQAAIRERDRKVRQFWFGFGGVLALVVLAVFAFAAWMVWTWLAALGAGVLAIPAIVVFLAVTAIGGHRCVTVVQHWH
ncbi:hypothetical protein [Actinoplanes awajinensis]|uniref:Uncharacterized protein n=1 Tax=Actinoplanes awajinensis subsp. mycoplanecinus TaxID=135947 RepID=A0A101JUN9_9ACTN|nr:hypothetical protein [Actinoplanes awajinensis]KUL33434.1 hypothetical protein ADL15_17605 [Actinoplanes awajinensis subsp. mycoplanecinus]